MKLKPTQKLAIFIPLIVIIISYYTYTRLHTGVVIFTENYPYTVTIENNEHIIKSAQDQIKLKEGSYQITINKDGYQPIIKNIMITKDQEQTITPKFIFQPYLIETTNYQKIQLPKDKLTEYYRDNQSELFFTNQQSEIQEYKNLPANIDRATYNNLGNAIYLETLEDKQYTSHLYLITTDQLITFDQEIENPIFSPDSQSFYYYIPNKTNNLSKIYRINLATDQSPILVTNIIGYTNIKFNLNENNQQLIFTINEAENQITTYSLDINSGLKTKLFSYDSIYNLNYYQDQSIIFETALNFNDTEIGLPVLNYYNAETSVKNLGINAYLANTSYDSLTKKLYYYTEEPYEKSFDNPFTEIVKTFTTPNQTSIAFYEYNIQTDENKKIYQINPTINFEIVGFKLQDKKILLSGENNEQYELVIG